MACSKVAVVKWQQYSFSSKALQVLSHSRGFSHVSQLALEGRWNSSKDLLVSSKALLVSSKDLLVRVERHSDFFPRASFFRVEGAYCLFFFGFFCSFFCALFLRTWYTESIMPTKRSICSVLLFRDTTATSSSMQCVHASPINLHTPALQLLVPEAFSCQATGV
jgi:hypothetical protein